MLLKKKESGIVFLLLVVFLFSCSSSRKTTREEPPEKETPQYDESFDPLKLDDEGIVFKEEEKKVVEDKERTLQTPGREEFANEENRLVDGFRVQLFATKDIEGANIAKKEAEFVFTEDSLNIYIEFDSPYYKLRIGDFQDRDKAEQFREIAREKGYQSSWIVKTKVWSNPSLSAKEEIQLQN